MGTAFGGWKRGQSFRIRSEKSFVNQIESIPICNKQEVETGSWQP